MPELLKEWKVAIILVGQEYKSTEGCHDYKTSTRVTYRGQGQPMDIGRFNENFKMRSQSTSTVISMDTWQRNSKQRRKNEKPGHASNVTRKNILLETAKESRQ